jgi:hypothetical protein
MRLRLTGIQDEALDDQIAENLWKSHRNGTRDDLAWAECGSYFAVSWQRPSHR